MSVTKENSKRQVPKRAILFYPPHSYPVGNIKKDILNSWQQSHEQYPLYSTNSENKNPNLQDKDCSPCSKFI